MAAALLLQPHPNGINIDPYEELEKVFEAATTGDNGEYIFLQNYALLLLRLEPRAAVKVFSKYTPLTHFVKAKAELSVIRDVAQMFKANISEYQGVSVFVSRRTGEVRPESHNAFHEITFNGGSWELANYIFREFPEMLLVQKSSSSNVVCLLESEAHPLAEKIRLLHLMFEIHPSLLTDQSIITDLFATALANRCLNPFLVSILGQAKLTFLTLGGWTTKRMAPEDICCLVPIMCHLKFFKCIGFNWGKEGYAYLLDILHLSSEIQSLNIPYLVGATPLDESTGQALFESFMAKNSSLQSLKLLIRDDDLDEANSTSLLEKAFEGICQAVQKHLTMNSLDLSANTEHDSEEKLTPMSGAAFTAFLMRTQLKEIHFEYFKLSFIGWPEHSQLSTSQCTKISIKHCHFAPEALGQLLVLLQNNLPNLRELSLQCASRENSDDPKIDGTAALCSLLRNDGCLEYFDFRAPRLCNVDMEVLFETLATNTLLTSFIFMVDNEDVDSAEIAMLNLLGQNYTLYYVDIIGKGGWSLLEGDNDVYYYLDLNHYGRAKVHARETGKAEFVNLLASINNDHGGVPFDKTYIRFGLLLERPSLWS